jgi:hypothetical protein
MKKLIKSIVVQSSVVIHVFQLELEIDHANCPCFRTCLLPTLKKINDYPALINIANIQNLETKICPCS